MLVERRIVWTTRDRHATIDRHRATYLWEHLPIIARQERARILELGIVTTHLHLLVRLHPSTVIPRLLQRMKGGTATQRSGGPESSLPQLGHPDVGLVFAGREVEPAAISIEWPADGSRFRVVERDQLAEGLGAEINGPERRVAG